jgi:HSP20 family protein
MNTTLKKFETRPVCGENQSTRQYLTPAVNIYENKDGYVVEAEMPGVRKEGLEVTLDGHELSVVGRRPAQASADEVYYRESEDADFRWTSELDPTIDTAKIVAKIDQGLLTLTLPKAEAVKPRRVVVND